MILTIWRHGEAGSAVTDRVRELTDHGRSDVDRGCRRFANYCEDYKLPLPGRLLYSEWVRTEQTCNIIEAHFTQAIAQSSRALIPGCRPNEVDTALESLRAGGEIPGHLLLVSHQPLVSSLVDYYLGEYGLVAPLLPGGLATLEMDAVGPGCASLCFSVQPPHFETSQ
jgi:phosphohistidine phosphatase